MDFEIDIQEEAQTDTSSIQLPLNFLTFGEIENDDVKVYIKQDVYKKLEEFASSDTSKELGSVILGDFCEELGKKTVIISDYIEAKYTDASASTLTFTHETWDYIHKEHEKSYSDKKIIGWQHTHPNYGIFLSNYDLFIQENFFNLPFQVAYVIDPIQNSRGFFQWKNGKIEKLKGFYIYDEVGVPIKLESKKSDKNSKPAPSQNIGSLITTIILSLAIVILGITVINQASSIKHFSAEQTELKTIVSEQAEEIASLQNQASNPFNNSVDTSTEEKLNDVDFIKYEVKSGDSLYSICEEHNLDVSSNLGIIKAINGLENEDSLFVGQVLLLPSYE